MNINWFVRLLNRFLPSQTASNVEQGVRHPMIWLKGEGLPINTITPWELLLFAISSSLGGMSGGFTGRRDFLFKEVYKVPPNYLSVAGVVSSLWDAVNDPLLGAWMDKKQFGVQTLKLFMRISAFTGHSLNILKMIDGGLSAWQHVALLMFCNMSQDIIGTLDGIAGQKIRSGISPETQQRTRVRVWSNMGGQMTWLVANLPTIFMGFREYFGWTDYQIIFIGALVFWPLAITSSILPTFIKQRVDYSRPSPLIMAPGEGHPSEEKQMTIFQAFKLLKHNRYFLANFVARFITVFSPNVGDELLVYRYLIPKFKVLGKEMGGEGVLYIKQLISGLPSSLMQPFNRQLINKMGGPLKAQQVKSMIDAGGKLIQFLVGYNTIPKLAVIIAAETAINASVNWDGVAEEMLNFEFYDFVELKTGHRSEGVTAAINGLFSKIVTDNIGLVTGNAFLQWTGYKGGYTEAGTLPPERYMKWMWPMYTLIPVLDNLLYILCRSFVKWKPSDREKTEMELMKRREAQIKQKEEAAVQE